MMATRGRFRYDYPRPAVTVDIAVLRPKDAKGERNKEKAERKKEVAIHVAAGLFEVLLIQRKSEPFKGCWALPGGFVDEGESLEAAARRELAEETGLRRVPLRQLAAFGDPGRDPRGWTVSVAFCAIVSRAAVRPKAADDAAAVRWFPLKKLPALAFDHEKILAQVRNSEFSAAAAH